MNNFNNNTQEQKHCVDCPCKSSIFDSLTTDELKLLNENRYELTYKAHETIFKQGSMLPHFMIFVSGLAILYLEGMNHRDLILKLLTPGDIAGCAGFESDKRLHYSAKAIKESTACFIDSEIIYKIMRNNNEFTMRMYRHLNEQNVYNFNKFISFTQKHMQGRVAEILIYLSENIYNSKQFAMELSRQNLADLTALSKESVIRILKKFKEDGLIREKDSVFEIIDIENLLRISTI